MGRTSDVHKWDFLGLETSIRRLIFYSVQSGSVCNSPILLGNTIYMGILVIWLSVFCYVHSASAYVTYWVLYSRLILHYRWYCRYRSWRRATDFPTATSVYEHFDAAVFLLRVLYPFWMYPFWMYLFWVCMHKRPTEYGIMEKYISYSLYIYIWMEFSICF